MFGHQILNVWSFLTWSRSCWKLPSMPQSQTMGAVNVEKSSHCFLQSAVLEANAILSVPWKVFSAPTRPNGLIESQKTTCWTPNSIKKNGKYNGPLDEKR